jgi:hypothetical protein
LSATTLCCHGDHIVASNHEDTLVLDKLAVADEECTTVNVEDLALTAFASVFLNIVLVSNFGTVAVGGYSMLVPADDLRHLCV